MTRRTRYVLLALVGAALVAAFALHRWPWRHADDLGELQRRVEALAGEAEAARAAPDLSAAYAPRVAGSIVDLQAPAAEILRQLPGIARVEALVTSDRPTHRIIHFRDWHHVSRDHYAEDLGRVMGRAVVGKELDLRYDELLTQVELVTIEQTGTLRCLIVHHGLQRVLCEGLTVDGMGQFSEIIEVTRQREKRLAEFARERALMKNVPAELDRELAGLMKGNRELQRMLPYGAPGRLAIDGAADVLPLDDEQALDAARPAQVGKIDPEKLQARHDAQVKAAMAAGPVAVIVLGANHELSESVRRLGGGTTEYLRVTTKAVQRFAGASP